MNDATRLDQANRPTQAILSAWREAYAAHGPLALVRLTSGSNHCRVAQLWASAMTAHFGPTGLHASRRRADGTPDPEQCTDLDFERLVSGPMVEARARIESALAWADAEPATFASCW